MEKWFEKQSKLVQVLLLIIPGVNWVVEVLVRWDHALRTKSLLKIVIAILVTFVGLAFGWLDALWCVLFGHMLLCD